MSDVDSTEWPPSFPLDPRGSWIPPVPFFGGRDAALAALDEWLADPSAPPYALLTGEGGQGKSTLLARWAAQRQARDEAALLFLPISRRLKTASAHVALAALATRLGALHQERIKPVEWGADKWRAFCQRRLRRPMPGGKPVVVLLDGLDEAAGWTLGADFFPREAPPGLRVVVAARSQAGDGEGADWRQRLGWESEALAREWTLPPLTLRGVSEMLAAMRNPPEHRRPSVDLVGHVHRLSQGNPLLVRLYVTVLAEWDPERLSLRPEALATIPPGLGGYVGWWWDAQRQRWGEAAPRRERVAKTVLAIVAAALGPLERATLLRLPPQEAGLSTENVAEALASLHPFIVGDGVTSGVALCHPRLGDAFDQEEGAARHLALGAAVLTALEAGTLAPQAAPSYVIQYYRTFGEKAPPFQGGDESPVSLIKQLSFLWIVV